MNIDMNKPPFLWYFLTMCSKAYFLNFDLQVLLKYDVIIKGTMNGIL